MVFNLTKIRRLSFACKKALSFQTLLKNGNLYSTACIYLTMIIRLDNVSLCSLPVISLLKKPHELRYTRRARLQPQLGKRQNI
ncbi:MAG: hypothetical protein COB20_00940 [SAR86 cluster bacterium]|uniref:Uncharacterized protein n=1 Tax=SAR86 cluster bacterium TaxID=2030880 RepID=A0A2A4XGV0_9GAMM|nr:MAG: hypothetical protein COB20_00940 [SAR86 cluster bacterium]